MRPGSQAAAARPALPAAMIFPQHRHTTLVELHPVSGPL
jgi:hypothetical protein